MITGYKFGMVVHGGTRVTDEPEGLKRKMKEYEQLVILSAAKDLLSVPHQQR
jgi:alpha-L-fucosidase